MALIEIRNLCKQFNGRQVLDDINLDINQGETMVVIGGSGCGKTTLLNLLAKISSMDFSISHSFD